ncbi:hypothetical protein HDK77DRAFT_242749 [Phyllosticta capitalensis]
MAPSSTPWLPPAPAMKPMDAPLRRSKLSPTRLTVTASSSTFLTSPSPEHLDSAWPRSLYVRQSGLSAVGPVDVASLWPPSSSANSATWKEQQRRHEPATSDINLLAISPPHACPRLSITTFNVGKFSIWVLNLAAASLATDPNSAPSWPAPSARQCFCRLEPARVPQGQPVAPSSLFPAEAKANSSDEFIKLDCPLAAVGRPCQDVRCARDSLPTSGRPLTNPHLPATRLQLQNTIDRPYPLGNPPSLCRALGIHRLDDAEYANSTGTYYLLAPRKIPPPSPHGGLTPSRLHSASGSSRVLAQARNDLRPRLALPSSRASLSLRSPPRTQGTAVTYQPRGVLRVSDPERTPKESSSGRCCFTLMTSSPDDHSTPAVLLLRHAPQLVTPPLVWTRQGQRHRLTCLPWRAARCKGPGAS